MQLIVAKTTRLKYKKLLLRETGITVRLYSVIFADAT